MSEILHVRRTTPYGFQLEDGSYRNASKPVISFIAKYLPGDIEVIETSEGPKGLVITKVTPLGGSFPNGFTGLDAPQIKPATSFRQDSQDESNKQKMISVLVSYAKDEVVARINQSKSMETQANIDSFWEKAIENVENAYDSFKQKLG